MNRIFWALALLVMAVSSIRCGAQVNPIRSFRYVEDAQKSHSLSG